MMPMLAAISPPPSPGRARPAFLLSVAGSRGLCGTTFRNGSTRNGRAVCGFLEFCSRQVTLSTKLTADSFRYDGHCETSGGLVWRRGGDRTREFEMTPLSRRQVEPRLKSWMPFLAGGPAASRGHVLIGRYAERAIDGPVVVLLVGRP
jgi:hypothetical protein